MIIVTPYLVNPVNANDIKLPTDGYLSPNELQRLFGNMESDGKSGASRPMPMAAPQAVPPPKVGELIAPAGPATKPDKKRRDRRSADATKAAAPGFSLN